ncbi:MAG: hypothetical protein K1X64_04830 [Myxococcaceae bacterium]|nr:hypothetical protein [Myxococcaceae bacterium]
MRTISSQWGALLPAVCLVSAAAWAIPTNRPKIAVHPLKVGSGSPSEQRELKLFFKLTVSAAEEIEVPLETEVVQALEKNGYASCDRDDECLRRVAVATGSVYALYAAVGLDGLGDNVVVAARVVRSDAVPMGKGVTLTRPMAPGRKFSEVAKEALTKLVAQLKLAELPPALPASRSPSGDAPVALVSPSAAATADAPPPPPLVTVERPVNKWRVSSYVAGGVGVVAVGVGAVLLKAANDSLGDARNEQGVFKSEQHYQNVLGVPGRQKAGVGLIAGGAALVAAAGGAFWYSMHDDAPVASVMIDGRGAMVLVSMPLK